MSTIKPPPPTTHRTWNRKDASTKQFYLVSTRRDYLSTEFIQTAFAGPHMPWAQRLTDEAMEKMLDNSFTFGLYVTASLEPGVIYSEMQQIGLARFITDHVTFAYLTDVYVEEKYRGKGLATWLIKCCQEVIGVMGGEAFRRSALYSGNVEWGTKFYKETMGMVVIKDQEKGCFMTWKKPHTGQEEKLKQLQGDGQNAAE